MLITTKPHFNDEFLIKTISSANLGFWEFGSDGINHFSEKIYDLLSLDNPETSAANFVSNIIEEDIALFLDSKTGTAMRSRPHNLENFKEINVFRVHGSSHNIRYIRCVAMKNSLTLSGYLEDITNEKKSEIRKLGHYSRMITIGEMTLSILHEINNPLSIIQGYNQCIRNEIHSEVEKNENLKLFLSGIETSVDRVNKIINSVKALGTESEKSKYEKINIKACIMESVKLCQLHLTTNSVDVELELRDDLTIECNPIQISQVMINLINNSILAIKIFSPRWIKIYARKLDDKIQISVQDCGDGIQSDIAKMMMNPFFTTRSSMEGTGLGLSISKEIAAQHNGKLYYNDLSKNTEFILELPVVQIKTERHMK